MSVLAEVVRELLGMFVADARLTLATLALVAVVAALLLAVHVAPMLAGAILLVGCFAVLIEATVREARRRRR
ncbi:hypothetical protein [Mesorhizobium sp. SP-1A]|uniref:hypothetical protein n=1 Tax=Mesorhizobium sp. SP-1A TaxID=3077840 RepID=UPI0028F6CFCA|nr:hypothetical protein [Mesorhizobium sp. SP-1A]